MQAEAADARILPTSRRAMPGRRRTTAEIPAMLNVTVSADEGFSARLAGQRSCSEDGMKRLYWRVLWWLGSACMRVWISS